LSKSRASLTFRSMFILPIVECCRAVWKPTRDRQCAGVGLSCAISVAVELAGRVSPAEALLADPRLAGPGLNPRTGEPLSVKRDRGL
jgi:hypothetical protein